MAEDLAVIEQRARELGFHVATRRTYRKPYRYHLALALDRAGWRRRDLCTIRPDEDQRGFRVSPSGRNLRVGLHLDEPSVWGLFGAEGDRLWDPGSGASFVNEVLEQLATAARSVEHLS